VVHEQIAANRITLVPASMNQADALAALMVQLYNSELKGGLRGSPAGQRALLRYFIERAGNEGLWGRYLAIDTTGALVGTVSLRLHSDSEFGTIPSGAVRVAIRELGLWNTLQLFGTMFRAMFTPATVLTPRSAYIYSVVIDEQRRGQGLGRSLMGAIEQLAYSRGVRRCTLRILVDNHGARRLYTSLGYRVIERSPRWMDWLTFPTELMAKTLEGAP
jgi:ribosomal protein S18 acetylase RimI-like enzyme